MKTRTWVLLGSCALLGGVAALDLRPSRPASPPQVDSSGVRSGHLLAGAGRAHVELPEGVPLAGYRPFGREAAGSHRPAHVRAMLLEVPGLRVAVVLAELLTMPAGLARAFADRASAQGAGCTVVIATHTHAGPGGYDGDPLPQAVATGRYDPDVTDALLAAGEDALAAAALDLGMAQLSTGEVEVPELVKNRDRPGADVDRRLTVLALDRPDGTRVARLVRLAAHPTLAGRATGLDGDWPARVMEGLEEQGGVALVVQGAVGDATAVASGEDRAASFAAAVLERVRGVPLAEVGPPAAMGCAGVGIELPAPQAGGAVPAPLRTLAGNALALLAPHRATATTVRVDDLLLVFEPAELTAAAEEDLRAAIAGTGLRARSVALAQGYLGYAPTASAFAAGHTATRYSWFGPALAERLTRGAAEAARALSSPAAAPAPSSPTTPTFAPEPAAARRQP